MLRTNFPDIIFLVHRYAEESGDLLGDLKVSDLLLASLNTARASAQILFVFRSPYNLSYYIYTIPLTSETLPDLHGLQVFIQNRAYQPKLII